MSKLLNIKFIDEGEKGITTVLNSINHKVKRIYFIQKVKNQNIIRGGHKHKKTHQTLFVLSGSMSINIIINKKKISYKIKSTDKKNAIYLEPKDWHDMYNFSKDCLVCVIASEKYLKSDYIVLK